jgi:hypothetical protein
VDVAKNASERLSAVKGDAGEGVSTKMHVMLNPGFFYFCQFCQVLNGDDVYPPEDIASERIPLLKYTLVTSSDVERYFSAYRHILSDERHWLQTIWKRF